MKQFGILALGLGLALMTACSKDDEPNIPQEMETPEETVPEWSGKFEGQWKCWDVTSTKGSIEVDGNLEEGNMAFHFPAEAIFDYFIQTIRTGSIDRPIHQEHLNDTIGNIFFANSYVYKSTRQNVTFKLDTASDGSYHASDITLYNAWSLIGLCINIDKEPPYPGETINIGPIGLNTIAFDVEADGVPYLVTLNNTEKKLSLDFDAATGLWTFTYPLDAFKIFNLDSGKEYSFQIVWSLGRFMKDVYNLVLKATQRTGPSDGISDGTIIYY